MHARQTQGQLTTPLIWRAADPSPALLALRKVATAVARLTVAR